jgi:hypothetical protein
MSRFLLALSLLALATPASADWFYRFVGYTCDAKRDRLVIHYEGVSNEEGELRRSAARPNVWEPDSLIASMKDDDHIGDLTVIEKPCKTQHASYLLRLGPTPGDYNIQGSCGAVVTAWVEVRRNGRLLLPRYELEGDCHDMDAPVTTRIDFAGNARPRFTKMKPSEFIK